MIKKKIMIGALAALFLSVGIFAATNLQKKEQVSDLTLANIEAMTNIYDIDGYVADCLSNPYVDCIVTCGMCDTDHYPKVPAKGFTLNASGRCDKCGWPK